MRVPTPVLWGSVLVIALSAILAGCSKAPERVDTVGSDFAVHTLFTHDGCTVYRFRDSGRFIYYANCHGDTTTSWRESCGKNCTRDREVKTYRDKERN